MGQGTRVGEGGGGEGTVRVAAVRAARGALGEVAVNSLWRYMRSPVAAALYWPTDSKPERYWAQLK